VQSIPGGVSDWPCRATWEEQSISPRAQFQPTQRQLFGVRWFEALILIPGLGNVAAVQKTFEASPDAFSLCQAANHPEARPKRASEVPPNNVAEQPSATGIVHPTTRFRHEERRHLGNSDNSTRINLVTACPSGARTWTWT
jgi:hypothetical protein